MRANLLIMGFHLTLTFLMPLVPEQSREAMMNYWAAFLRTGKPHAKNLPEWPAFSPSAPKAMVFGTSGIEAKGFRIQ